VGVVEWVYWVVTGGKEMAFSRRVVRMLAQERTFDIGKIRERLGYRPRFSTAQGVERAVGWYLENRKTGGEGKKES
jgi:sterol-4alpha-carboxylate 3-dehydrogenase (decarboxylating)